MHEDILALHHVLTQMGVPSDKAQYVHRVGRTARAGKVRVDWGLCAIHRWGPHTVLVLYTPQPSVGVSSICLRLIYRAVSLLVPQTGKALLVLSDFEAGFLNVVGNQIKSCLPALCGNKSQARLRVALTNT
jgi:superfamily II DNA/RNA helicase